MLRSDIVSSNFYVSGYILLPIPRLFATWGQQVSDVRVIDPPAESIVHRKPAIRCVSTGRRLFCGYVGLGVQLAFFSEANSRSSRSRMAS